VNFGSNLKNETSKNIYESRGILKSTPI